MAATPAEIVGAVESGLKVVAAAMDDAQALGIVFPELRLIDFAAKGAIIPLEMLRQRLAGSAPTQEQINAARNLTAENHRWLCDELAKIEAKEA